MLPPVVRPVPTSIRVIGLPPPPAPGGTRPHGATRPEAEPPLGRARAAALGPLDRAPYPHPLEDAGVGAEGRKRRRRQR